MFSISKKNTDEITKYINIIENKVFEKNFENRKHQKLKKINEKYEDLIIPTYKNIENLLTHNYSVYHLKIFAKYYNLKIGGTKNQLIKRIFCFIFLSNSVTKIQKIFRGHLEKYFIKLKGPALFKRNICVNSSDFLTFENIEDISYNQFFSFKDEDNFVYGFDILSIYNLLYTKKDKKYILNEDVKNPYNRNIINKNVINDINKIIKLSKYFNGELNIKIKEEIELTNQQIIELKTLEIFQNINRLGNYSDSRWFLELDKKKIIKFVCQLYDIWNYRSQITDDVKKMICPPYGNPFIINLFYFKETQDINFLRKNSLIIMEEIINNGINNDYKLLGCYYILAAITLVNENAASSLPWLYNSVV